ncbi:MAG: filamentous hemagglutinin N-terminal domain-containing protein [Verrucomicrobia bacterium]|nr:filamentous hemagglutinin N-terminal domain-containing protein [Verrucomicrobiota bacterium]
MQSAARHAAASQAGSPRPDPMRPGQLLPSVPNGLGTGALQPVAGAVAGSGLWTGAELPEQHQELSGIVRVNVRQNAAQALLNWETFNVGAQTHLHFEQQQGGVEQPNWVVVNRVQDPSTYPSQILGTMSAPGQVYVLNRNGILFDGTSQVNVRSLTASSLPLNTGLLERGLLNNPDSQYLFSSTSIPAGNNGMESFTPDAPNSLLGRFGDVWVAAGARLNSPLNEDQSGGRIFIAAPNVTNEGTLTAPNGQIILAAGQQVGVVAHRNDDPSLRGLDAFVGSVAVPGLPSELSGTVVNSGLISVERGNITLTGRDLHLDGLLYSTTSVALNGRIDLLASFDAFANPESSVSSGINHRSFLPRSSGSITVAPDAVITVLPEVSSEDTVAASELALRSQVNFQANSIQFGAESFLYAPNALVSLQAGRWMFRSVPVPESIFVNAEGSIRVDQGAVLSVAGLPGVDAPNERNFLRVELRGAELADAPLQREGNLRGREIVVDTRISGSHNGFNWVGTPLADVTGFLGLIERTVAELSTAAGSLTLNAGGVIDISDNALLDVSGGWFNFAGGPVATTRLLYGNRVVDIANAFPEVRYDGIYTGTSQLAYARWGVVETFAHALAPLGPQFEPAYFQGADAGALSLTAASMQLNGIFSGATFDGDRQRATQAAAGRLQINLETRDLSISPQFPVIAPVATRVILGGTGTESPGSSAFVGGVASPTLQLAPSLLSPTNFGSLTVRNRGGDISVPSDTRID